MPVRRPRLPNHATGPPLRHPQLAAHERHRLPASGRAQKFPETTLFYVGLGFAELTPSWGSMLQEAENVPAIADFPWLLTPAAGIVMVVLAVNLLARARGESNALGLHVRIGRR